MKKMDAWTKSEIRLFQKLSSPIKIQHYLNSIAYDAEYATSSPRWVIKERKANCFEGALFAAAALRQLGHKPLLVDIRSLSLADKDLVKAGLLGAKKAGLYKPKK